MITKLQCVDGVIEKEVLNSKTELEITFHHSIDLSHHSMFCMCIKTIPFIPEYPASILSEPVNHSE